MRKAVIIVVLVCICAMLSGCIIVGGKSERSNNTCQGCVDGDPVFAEIRAARRLVAESSKLDVYTAIAKRPDLSPNARAYLAEEATRNLIAESSKRDVLMQLAKNYPPKTDGFEP